MKISRRKGSFQWNMGFSLCPDVCVQKGRTWFLFRLQVFEMSENVLLKMGKFAALLNMYGWQFMVSIV